MRKPNYLELMFLHMQELGFYKEYKTYQDWKVGKGIKSPPENKKEDFRETLTSGEQEQYTFMFGEESG